MVKFVEPKPTWRLLHALCISNNPLESRLPALRQALEAGEDPNELGGWRHYPGIQRPLHYAIDDSIRHDPRQLKQNLPIVELLLRYGADPRLPDLNTTWRSPIEELERWFQYHDEDHDNWPPEDLELIPFYSTALCMMKDKVAELDGKHDALVWRNRPFRTDSVRDSTKN